MNAVLEEKCLTEKKEQPGKRILFVRTGNTCRSPMAAALYNDRFSGDGSYAVSAGLAADGSGISGNAVMALLGAGIRSTAENDYLSHVSHTVTEEDLEKADLVVGITGRHATSLLFAAPGYASRITSLPMDIPDPYGGDLPVYEACLEKIGEALDAMFTADKGEDHV